jgi:hypothetical protein
MNIRVVIFLMVLIISGCGGDEGSDLPSPCTVATPEINFKFETGLITLTWNRVGTYKYSLSYLVESEPNSFYAVSLANPTDTFAVIRNFHPGTTYEAELSVKEEMTALNRCNGRIDNQSFTVPCAAYNKINIQGLTTNAATVSWDEPAEPDAKLFTVNLRKKGTTDITLFSTDKENVKITSLESKTEYQVQLASTCTDNQVYLSAWKDFTTL